MLATVLGLSFRRQPDVARSAENVRMDGPEGVSEANHPATFSSSKSLGPGFRLSLDHIFSGLLISLDGCKTSQIRSLPCLQGRARVGCERSERRDLYVAAGICRHMIHTAGTHRDIRQRAKAQATPPQPSPTAAGEGAILARLGSEAELDL
jgi:hypothetical protein